MPPLLDQHWLHRRLQRHWLSRRQCPFGDLHHLLHLPHFPTHPWRAAPTTPLEPRPLWYLHQPRRSAVSACGMGLRLLPRRDSRHAYLDELELCHVWRDHDLCHRVLPLGGTKDLHVPVGVGKEELGDFYSPQDPTCVRALLNLNFCLTGSSTRTRLIDEKSDYPFVPLFATLGDWHSRSFSSLLP